MHVKRQTISKDWPIAKKGTKYLVRASHDKERGIPLLIILRDILKIAKNRKEVRRILNEKLVSINSKTIKKENLTVLPFDIIKVKDKVYELGFSDNGKFEVRESKKKELTLKIINKKILKNKKVQLNLLYGKNMLSDEKVRVGDSVILSGGKIVKILPLEKGKEAVVLSGKYKGKTGEIEEIKEKLVSLSYKDKKINISVRNIMVVK